MSSTDIVPALIGAECSLAGPDFVAPAHSLIQWRGTAQFKDRTSVSSPSYIQSLIAPMVYRTWDLLYKCQHHEELIYIDD